MIRYTRHLWIALLAVTAAMRPALAENPKVSLKVVDVKPAEALSQLSQASGVKVELYNANFAGNQPGATDKVSFDWTGTTFARALRQFCEKMNLRPNRSASGYVLYPSFNAAAPPKKLVGLVEKSGVKIFTRSISVEDRRSKNFMQDQPDNSQGYLNLQLGAEVEGDAEAISGVANVVARDDTGNYLSSDPNRNYGGGYWGNQYPDEWSGNLNLGAASPRAKKLLWLEGDLMAFRIVKPLKIEIPLPITSKSVRKQAGEWLIVVSQYQDSPKKEDEEDEGLPKIGIQAPQQNLGPTMRIRVYYPSASKLVSRTGWGITPTLVDGAGKSYYPSRNNGSGWGDGQMTLNDNTVSFPAIPNAGPMKLVWDLVERSEPVKLCSFRMTDIPLPEGASFVPRLTRPLGSDGPTGPSVDTSRPFYEKGGGVLINEVSILDKPANLGMLQVGLAPKTASGWGPVRWIDVPVDVEGIGRLADVKPGTYRLQRTYKAERNAPLPAGGKWLNGETVVTLTAGKDATPASYRWSTGAEAPAKPAVRTPVKPATGGARQPAVKPAALKVPAGGK